MLKRVAVYSKDSTQKTRDGVQRLVNELCKRNIIIQLQQKADNDHKLCDHNLIHKFSDFNSLAELPELILSVGGDGTFLETVLKVRESGIPVAGVNTGRMGFLANIPGDDISSSIDQLCRGDYEVIERSLLEISQPSNPFGQESPVALNEVTIQKSNLSMITINVYVDDIYLNTYWADGLIVSTATGSTAYNLSVGGPILSPEDDSFVISPISPHNLTIRPIVLSGKSRLRMNMEGRTTECLLTSDFRSCKISLDEEIKIRMADTKLKTVMLKGRDFYGTLRNKLMWGLDKRN